MGFEKLQCLDCLGSCGNPSDSCVRLSSARGQYIFISKHIGCSNEFIITYGNEKPYRQYLYVPPVQPTPTHKQNRGKKKTLNVFLRPITFRSDIVNRESTFVITFVNFRILHSHNSFKIHNIVYRPHSYLVDHGVYRLQVGRFGRMAIG